MDRAAYYETPAAVSRFVNRYSPRKERAFCQFLSRFIPAGARVLEIGGGAGVHGKLLSETIAGDYCHSDRSEAMCASARQLGVKSIRLDALRMGGAPPFDVLLAVELSTIRDPRPALRRAQFREIAARMPTGSILIASTARGTMHTLDENDVAMLENEGVRHEATFWWGVFPRHFWRAPLGRIEAAFAHFPLGIRKISVFSRAEPAAAAMLLAA